MKHQSPGQRKSQNILQFPNQSILFTCSGHFPTPGWHFFTWPCHLLRRLSPGIVLFWYLAVYAIQVHVRVEREKSFSRFNTKKYLLCDVFWLKNWNFSQTLPGYFSWRVCPSRSTRDHRGKIEVQRRQADDAVGIPAYPASRPGLSDQLRHPLYCHRRQHPCPTRNHVPYDSFVFLRNPNLLDTA